MRVKSRGGRGYSNIKKVGVLVVSLRGVNFRFWSIFLAFKVSLRFVPEEMQQIFLKNLFY